MHPSARDTGSKYFFITKSPLGVYYDSIDKSYQELPKAIGFDCFSLSVFSQMNFGLFIQFFPLAGEPSAVAQ